MAYVMTHFWPGGTEEQYRVNLAAVHPEGGLPDGQTHHAAGPTEGGFLIVALWESKGHADRFWALAMVVNAASEPMTGHFDDVAGLVGSPLLAGFANMIL